MKVLPNSLYLNCYTLGLHSQKLEPPCQWLLFQWSHYVFGTMVLTSQCTYKNMTTISVFLATSSRDASDSRNACNDSLYRADAVAYPPACHTTHITKHFMSMGQRNISLTGMESMNSNTLGRRPNNYAIFFLAICFHLE